MTPKYDTATPYLAVYVLLRRGDDIAFVLRSGTDWMNGHYGLVAGKVEKNESFTNAAIREAKEEAGVTIKAEDLRAVLTTQRHHDDSDWVDVIFEVSTWEGEPYNAEPHMHSELAWLDTNNLPENVIPANVFFLDCIKQGKTYAELGWDE